VVYRPEPTAHCGGFCQRVKPGLADRLVPVSAYDLNGKVALVTGAARGIGLETARQMHARGASVALSDIDGDGAKAAAEGLGERALGMAVDVREQGQLEESVAKTVEAFGGLDVAVANAGIAPAHVCTTRLADRDEWERILDVNLLGVWRTAWAALPQVVERRGQLVLVASVYAFFNGVCNSAYASAKAGVESLGRSLRAELSPLGASATVAYFGFIDTRMVQVGFEDPVAKRLEEYLPLWATRRLGPDAAGAAIVRGVERRAPRVIAPKWWGVYSVMRGAINPLLDRRMETDAEMQAMLQQAERPDRAAGAPPTG
jgi:NAD(P)-dependent dehydrogenase (short-subunit alcohol dehydrogenase family)